MTSAVPTNDSGSDAPRTTLSHGALRAVGGALHEAITLPIYRLMQRLILNRMQRIAARMHHA